MKRIYLLTLGLLGLFAFAACTDELVPDPAGEEQVAAQKRDSITISVSLEQNMTKTLLSDTEVLWIEGDQIRIFNASTPNGEVFTLDGIGGETTGTFSGPALTGDGPFYAVYPATAATALDGSTVNLTVPGTQVYETAWDTFGVGANLSAGTAEALTDGFTFRNVFGVLRLTISGSSAVKSIVLNSKAESDVLNGAFALTFSDGIPVATPASGQTGEAFHKLMLDCDLAGYGVPLAEEGSIFYLVVPAGTLDAGMTIEVFDEDDYAMIMNAGVSSGFIVRSNIRPMPSFAYAPQYNAAFLTSEAVSGAFPGVSADGTLTEGCAYNEESGQYSYKNTPGDSGSRYFRIQDWSAGFALALTTPYVLKAGKKATVTVESLGETGVTSTADASMKVLKKVGNRVWLYDPNSDNGYIMMMVED